MFLGVDSVATDATVKTQRNLTIPAKATGAVVMADTQDVRYTMDNTTDPTSTLGMIFRASGEPREFLIEDIRRIRFIQGAGGAGRLNLHYFAGRDI